MSLTSIPRKPSARDFDAIRRLVQEASGIAIRPERDRFVAARLGKRLEQLRLGGFDEYVRLLERDRSGEELAHLLEAVATHTTSFFREERHFSFLRSVVFPELAGATNAVRIWSAGCSTGQEAVSIAISSLEYLPEIERRDVRILATDISRSAVEHAIRGLYDRTATKGLTPSCLGKYFFPMGRLPSQLYLTSSRIRGLIRWARLNLLSPWPMRGTFDVIFCRNVMIYFHRAAQLQLVGRFREKLRSGGYLFVGHSESLAAAVPGFRYVRPAVYVRDDAGKAAKDEGVSKCSEQ